MTKTQAKTGMRVWLYGDDGKRIVGTIIRPAYPSTVKGRWACVIAPDGWRTNRTTLDKGLFWPLRKVHPVAALDRLQEAGK